RDLAGRAERLAPDAPVPVVDAPEERLRPGGAALAAQLAARDGRDVTLVAAVGDDPASTTLRELLDPRVTLVPLPLDGTLSEKTRVLARNQPLVRLDRGDGRARAGTDAAARAIRSAGALLVSDYGRGSVDTVRDLVAEQAWHAPLVWDPHPRGGPPVPGTRLATPSAAEARHFCAALEAPPGNSAPGLSGAARTVATLVRRWGVTAVAVTLGDQGALLSSGGHQQGVRSGG
ncbi:PfkB family carbohydrate kinase, partial [Streptomyces sp. 2A115]|uniref:PfkB family carbohydrate kinase n=1 Tax=Streptomyces sp. 2A115 TaxID=3457439 RepID=UPI003FD0F700